MEVVEDGRWKIKWTKVKGHPWVKAKLPTYLKICRNCIIETLFLDCGLLENTSVSWYNNQILISCKAGWNVDWNNDKAMHDCTCDDILKIYSCLIGIEQDLEKELQDKKSYVELHRLLHCLCIVWLTKSEKRTYVSDLMHLMSSARALFHDECFLMLDFLCCVENPLQRLTDANSSHSSIFVSMLRYAHSRMLYRKQDRAEALQHCLDSLSRCDSTSQSATSLLHNLIACCYASLNKYSTAVMHLRKAIVCLNQPQDLALMLFNLYHFYEASDMSEASKKILKLIRESATGMVMTTKRSVPVFVIDTDGFGNHNLSVTTQLNSTTSYKVKYFAASCYLQCDMHSDALDLYKEFLEESSTQLTSFRSIHSDDLPIVVPSRMQIDAEMCCALHGARNADELEQFECAHLSYCSACFKKAQAKIDIFELGNDVLIPDLVSYNEAAEQFYHCLCVLLYKIAAVILSDCKRAVSEIEACLLSMDTVLPPANVDAPDTLEPTNHLAAISRCCKLSRHLAFVKAKFYFNHALAASCTSVTDQVVVTSLQSALQYDCKSVEMRWNVTILLWKVGLKEESIKTWCKTRNIDYRQNTVEIQEIRNNKTKLLESCNSTKRNLISKDICILSELLLLCSK